MSLVVPIAAVLLALGTQANTAVHPTPPASDSPDLSVHSTPQNLLARASKAYRAAPIAERVTIAVSSDGRTRFDEIIIRLSVAEGSRDIRLELPTLTIWASTKGRAGVLVASHAQNDNAVVQIPLNSPLSAATLRHYLPAIIAPQIGLALDGPAALDASAWSVSGSDTIARQLPTGLVTLRFDPMTGRLLAYRRQTSGVSIRLRITPIEAGDPDSWNIATTGKRTVSAISELRASPPTIPIGQVFPFRILQDASMNPWPIEIALASRSGSPRRPEERYLVLVFHRVPDEDVLRESILERVGLGIDAASAVEQSLARLSRLPEGLGPRKALVRVVVRPVACLTIPQARRKNIDNLAARWPLDTGGSGLLWIVSPQQTIDRLSPGSDAVVVVIDEQSRLLRIVPIETNTDGDALTSTIEEAIMREVNLLATP